MNQLAADDGRATRARDTLLESEGVVALFRTLVVAVVLVAPATDLESGLARTRFYLAVGGVGLYCFLATLLIYKRVQIPFRRHLLLVVDIFLLTALILHTGGLRGPLFPLYYLAVIIGAMWFGLPGAVGAAALATLFFVVGVLQTVPPDRLYYVLRYQALTQILLLFLGAILCAYLAEAWQAERAEHERQRSIVEQFRKQIDMAQELQSLILPPRLPAVGGVDIGVRTRQAAVVVGGDYYDAIDFGDGTLGLCCADVSGKSVPGQLRLPLVKYAFRVCALELREPTKVLARLNGLLYDELPPEMFVSMVYAVIDPKRGTITMAGKHCPPLHWAARTGKVAEVPLQGVVLGMVPDIDYPSVEVPFAPDDYLLLYTDGVIEAKNRRGAELEVGGLVRLLGEATPESAQDLANWLFQALEEHEIGTKRDDLTLVVIRRTGARRA